MTKKSTAIFFGMNPPFLSGPQNVLSRQEDSQLIKNDLLQLLLTVPGERVMRPTFGVPLRSFVFEQLINSDISSLESAIASAINTWEPRVAIDELTALPDSSNTNGLQIRLVVHLVNDPSVQLVIEQFINLTNNR